MITQRILLPYTTITFTRILWPGEKLLRIFWQARGCRPSVLVRLFRRNPSNFFERLIFLRTPLCDISWLVWSKICRRVNRHASSLTLIVLQFFFLILTWLTLTPIHFYTFVNTSFLGCFRSSWIVQGAEAAFSTYGNLAFDKWKTQTWDQHSHSPNE